MEMPVALQNAAKSNDKDKFKEELSKYWKSLEKNITSLNQPAAYKIKGVSDVKVNQSGYSSLEFTAMDSSGKTRSIKVYVPETDDLTSVKDFNIDVDGKKSGTAKYTGIEKGASYVQLELAKILYPGEKKPKAEKKEKEITLMPSPKVPKNLKSDSEPEAEQEETPKDKEETKESPKKSFKNKNYSKVMDELNAKTKEGKLASLTNDARIIPSVSMYPSKGKYNPVVTFTFKPVSDLSPENVKSTISDVLSGVKNYISNIDVKKHGEKAMQVYVDVNNEKV